MDKENKTKIPDTKEKILQMQKSVNDKKICKEIAKKLTLYISKSY